MPEPLKLVRISNFLLRKICEEANRRYPYETGGILMGYYEPNGEGTVTEIIGPGPRAKHRRSSFEPDYDFQEKEVAAVYGKSMSQYTYIGDWHTHPNGTGTLSKADRTTMQGISRCPKARCTTPIMLLLVGNPRMWLPQLWELSEDDSHRGIELRVSEPGNSQTQDPIARVE